MTMSLRFFCYKLMVFYHMFFEKKEGRNNMDPYIVAEQVIDIIIEQLGLTDDEIENIRLDTRLIGDLGAFYLDIADLTETFMETFNISISNEEVQSLVSEYDFVPDIEIQSFLGLIMYKIEEKERRGKGEQ